MFSGNRDSWSPPLFRIGKVPFNLVATIVLVQVVCFFLLAARGEGLLTITQFDPQKLLNGEFWRVFTYPFFEKASLFSLIGYFLFYLFGNQLEAQIGRKKFQKILLATLFIPAATSLLMHIFGAAPPGVIMQGSPLFLVAVIIGFSVVQPEATGLLGAKFKWLGPLFALFALLSSIGNHQYGMAAATITTSAFVVFFLQGRSLPLGNFQFGKPAEEFSPRQESPHDFRTKPKRRRKQEKKLKPRTVIDTNSATEVDRILDKINDQGFQSLTDKEKKTLQESAKD